MDKTPETIVILPELMGEEPAPVTQEMLTLARRIQELGPYTVKFLIAGNGIEAAARRLAEHTGEDVLAVEAEALSPYNTETHLDVLAEALPPLCPRFVLTGQTPRGMDFAPRLAVRLGAGCISGVDGFSSHPRGPVFSRTAFGGKIALKLAPAALPTVITVTPGAFSPQEATPLSPGRVERASSSLRSPRSRTLGIVEAPHQDRGLSEADVIVAAGRGIGPRENLDLIERLAAKFPRSAVGASRPLCDQGWLEYPRQVGLTGATVAPKLYFACGISGAIQHTVGMQGSGFIVAVSRDPHAAIFRIADVCVVEDLAAFIPAFLAACEGEGGA